MTAQPIDHPSRGRKVLIVDDSDIQLHFAELTLRRAGFEVKTADSLAAFDEVLRSWAPDIVLSDVHMPEITGVELCAALKARLETSRTPVVLFSSLPEQALARLAKECGADGYLSKENGLDRLAGELDALTESILW